MSNRYIGGFIRPGYDLLKVPNAPTMGAVTGGDTQASVAFTAPTCEGGGAISSYTAYDTNNRVFVSNTSSPITVTGLTNGTSYVFRVIANNTFGPSLPSNISSSVTPNIVTGQQAFTTTGCFTWVAPTGVTSVSVVAVGGGAGAGGGLGYKNNITVVPGNSYSVKVGVFGSAAPASDSFFINGSTVFGGAGGTSPNGGTYVGDGGGEGGAMGDGGGCQYRGGGGAGGYSGKGGRGASSFCLAGFRGQGGNGGGGGGGSNAFQGRGGGVGLLGQGASGLGVCNSCGTPGSGGSGVSYGGGGGNTGNTPYGTGAVRIIWPGSTRSFPSTNTGNL